MFRSDGRVYEATASRMFGVPIDRVDKELRQRGKVATLALGYQGGPKALERMGALKMGIPEGELRGWCACGATPTGASSSSGARPSGQRTRLSRARARRSSRAAPRGPGSTRR